MNSHRKETIFAVAAGSLILLVSLFLIGLGWRHFNAKFETSLQKYHEATEKSLKLDQNIRKLQADTEDLKKHTPSLQRIFGKPYRKALLVFAASLKVSEDELYGLMKKVYENDEITGKVAGLLIPRFFAELEKEKQLTHEQVMKAYREFMSMIQAESLEDFDGFERVPEIGYEVLAAALGLPRVMKTDRAQRYVKDIQLYFLKQGLIPGVKNMRDIRNFTFNFDVPPSETEVVDILDTMPIYEDIFKRMSASRLELVNDFARERNQPETLPGGQYLSYGFKTTVTGTMGSVRDFLNNLLNAYKDNRVYVVTWISMTSPDTQAEVERMRAKLKPSTRSDREDDEQDGPEHRDPRRIPPRRIPRGRRPPRRETAAQNQARQADPLLDACGYPVIGKNRVTAVICFKYYVYIGDRLNKQNESKDTTALHHPVKSDDEMPPSRVLETLSANPVFNPAQPRGKIDPRTPFTDLMVPYPMAVCPRCKRLIPAASFPTGEGRGNCPFNDCRHELSAPETFALGRDTDGDGIPDEEEKKMGLNPNDARDGREDADLDGFTNYEEFICQTDYKDPNSRPPYHEKMSVRETPQTMLPFKLKNVTYNGARTKENAKLQIERQHPRPRLVDLKVGMKFMCCDEKYVVVDVIPKSVKSFERGLMLEATEIIVSPVKDLKQRILVPIRKEVPDPRLKTVLEIMNFKWTRHGLKPSYGLGESFLIQFSSKTYPDEYTVVDIDPKKNTVTVKFKKDGRSYVIGKDARLDRKIRDIAAKQRAARRGAGNN